MAPSPPTRPQAPAPDPPSCSIAMCSYTMYIDGRAPRVIPMTLTATNPAEGARSVHPDLGAASSHDRHRDRAALASPAAPLIQLSNVTKSYRTPRGPFVALRDVWVQVASGQLVAIVGRSR